MKKSPGRVLLLLAQNVVAPDGRSSGYYTLYCGRERMQMFTKYTPVFHSHNATIQSQNATLCISAVYFMTVNNRKDQKRTNLVEELSIQHCSFEKIVHNLVMIFTQAGP